MEKVLFDSSSHLGQFCISNENIRAGCKRSQAEILASANGVWTDAENGRVDKTIWSLSRELQGKYYDVMDLYFSEANVQQDPMTDEEMELSLALRKDLPTLHPYSRITCARAIVNGISEIHTLFAELLSPETRSYMAKHKISVIQPNSALKETYIDSDLEDYYWHALKAFRSYGLDAPTLLDDPRAVLLK